MNDVLRHVHKVHEFAKCMLVSAFTVQTSDESVVSMLQAVFLTITNAA